MRIVRVEVVPDHELRCKMRRRGIVLRTRLEDLLIGFTDFSVLSPPDANRLRELASLAEHGDWP
jgi:hypothetical protein